MNESELWRIQQELISMNLNKIRHLFNEYLIFAENYSTRANIQIKRDLNIKTGPAYYQQHVWPKYKNGPKFIFIFIYIHLQYTLSKKDIYTRKRSVGSPNILKVVQLSQSESGTKWVDSQISKILCNSALPTLCTRVLWRQLCTIVSVFLVPHQFVLWFVGVNKS